jgi:hypothetical protein
VRFLVGGAVFFGLLGACGGGKASDANCDRAAGHLAQLMDSGFKDQEHTIGGAFAKLCKDPTHGFTNRQVSCILDATTAATIKACAD